MHTAPMVGVVLDSLRDEAGLTVVALEKLTKIPRMTLRRRLDGDPKITFDEVERICAALGADVLDVYSTAATQAAVA